MRPDGDGVQFFDLVEDNWRSDHEIAGSAAGSSGFIAGATVVMRTAGSLAERLAEPEPPGGHARSTGPATRGAPITATTSALAGPANGTAAWGIMVPKS